MSPLEIQIMIHYGTTPGDWEGGKRFVEQLSHHGMLECPIGLDGRHFKITDKGKAYLEKLCSIPIPTESITYTFEEKE